MSRPATLSSRVQIFGLPSIGGLEDLERHTRLSRGCLLSLLIAGPAAYKRFPLPKKGGGTRQIAQPNRALKALQGWILRNILDRLETSTACKGFEPGESVVDNADPHVGAKAVLTLDIENFFPSVSIARVASVFKVAGYEGWAVQTLARYCTCDGALPQGGPCSPKLANLACFRLDRRLIGLSGSKGLVYTRYADDMTFSSSSPSRLAKALPFIQSIIEDEGFAVNERKTRLLGPGRCRKVTGLVLAHDFAGIGRQRLRQLRAQIFSLLVADPATQTPDAIAHIQGWLDYVHGADPRRYKTLVTYVRRLEDGHLTALGVLRLHPG